MKRAKRLALKAAPKWVCSTCKKAVGVVGKGGVDSAMREHRKVCYFAAGFQIKR